jgi:GrpB-like predicted nucleotidyltransferase (UPF0157 family)
LVTALADLPGAERAAFDHIGSTAVPGLAAKPFIDLQVRIEPLPSHEQLEPRLGPRGYARERGARSDSPGVSHDIPRPGDDAPDYVWEKRLYVSASESVILHIRHAESPWGLYTVWFRDWLRHSPEDLRRYEATKRQLAQANEGLSDYDDYTRAKTAFFDEVHPIVVDWARRRDTGSGYPYPDE